MSEIDSKNTKLLAKRESISPELKSSEEIQV